MWNAFGVIGSLVSTILGYYIAGNKTRAELDEAFYRFSQLRGARNESADDRESIENQRLRLLADREKAQDAALKALDDSLAKEAARIRDEKISQLSRAHEKAIKSESKSGEGNANDLKKT